MESNQSDENYEEFREEQSPSGRKVFIRTTKTQKSITTTTSSSPSGDVAQVTAAIHSSSTPVPIPRRRHRVVSSSSSTSGQVVPSAAEQQQPQLPPLSPPGVCSNITTIVFHETTDPAAADFARLESLAREREETPVAGGGGGVVRSRTTTTTVHQRTVTHLNQSSLHSTPSTSTTWIARGRPANIQVHSSDNDSLLEDNGSVAEESATFQNIHKFRGTYESTPVSSPLSSNYGQDRFASGDSLYRSAMHFSSPFGAASPSMGSPVSGGSHSVHGLETDEWKFSKTHQFQTRTGFYRSISAYDSHIKEIRGEKGEGIARDIRGVVSVS